MTFYKNKFLSCLNFKKKVRISFRYDYHYPSSTTVIDKDMTSTQPDSYRIEAMHIKKKRIQLPLMNTKRSGLLIGFSKLMYLQYRLYNQFDKTYFMVRNIYTNRTYEQEITDNYFFFPIEMDIELTIHDKQNKCFHYPCSLRVIPIPSPTDLSISWWKIGNQSNYGILRIEIDDMYWKEQRHPEKTRTIITFLAQEEYFSESKYVLLYGNTFKPLYYYTLIL